MKKIIFVLVALLLVGVVSAVDIDVGSGSAKITNYRYEPSPAQQGSYFDVWITVQNLKSSGTSAEASIVNDYPFISLSGKNIMGTLNKDESKQIKFRVKVAADAPAGDYDLRLRYKDSGGEHISSPMIITVREIGSEIGIKNIRTEPERLEQGKEGKLIFEIANGGGAVMRNIRIKLNFDVIMIAPIYDVPEKSISILPSGDEQTLSFNIMADANADSKAYKIPIDITYYNEAGTRYNKNSTLAVLVREEPKFLLNIDDSEVYSKGQNGEVVVSLSNIGAGELKFVSLTLLESDDYEVIGQDKVYLGNLESDDYETAEFKFYSKSRKDIPLKVLMEYKDSYNTEFNSEEELTLKMYSSGELGKYGIIPANGGLTKTLVYILVILFAYVWFKEWRKSKNIGGAFKTTLKSSLRLIIRIIKWIKWSNIKQVPKKIKDYYKKEG